MNSLAVNPTHRAYGITSRSQLLDANRIIVVVIQMHPTNMQISASNHSGCSSGVKHVCGRLYKVMQVHIRPRRVSPVVFKNKLENKNTFTRASSRVIIIPPTSVTIQSGIARLTIAKTSAAINKVALTVVNLSIFIFMESAFAFLGRSL